MQLAIAAGGEDRAQAAGGELEAGGPDIGVRRFHAFDPFGNRLELIDARDGGFTTRT